MWFQLLLHLLVNSRFSLTAYQGKCLALYTTEYNSVVLFSSLLSALKAIFAKHQTGITETKYFIFLSQALLIKVTVQVTKYC